MVVTLAAQVPLRVLMDQRAHTLHLTLRPPKNKNKRVSTARASAAAEAAPPAGNEAMDLDKAMDDSDLLTRFLDINLDDNTE